METKNKNLITWVVIGVIVIAVVVYVALSGGFNTTTPDGEMGEETEEQLEIAAPGTSPITSDGEVLNMQGEAAQNDVEPGTPEAPQQSDPISVESVPSYAKNITVTASGFEPSSFTVDAGSAVTITVTSGDAFTHIFKFSDPSLSSVAVGIAPGETRAISFKAPTGRGEYAFSCGVPGHAGRGEAGVMIVD